MLKLETIHSIDGKPTYCDIMTDQGRLTTPYNILKEKTKRGEICNYTVKNGVFKALTKIASINHEYGVNLYHVSFKKPKEAITIMTPRIPKSAAGLEDSNTPRVCFSESIAGAITGIPDGDCMLSTTSLVYDNSNKCNNIIFVGKITIGNRDSRLVNYRQLYSSNLVFDSLSTREYWWTSNSIALEFRKYHVESMEESFHYIVSDTDKEAIANELDTVSKRTANRIRSLHGEELYNYINQTLTKNKSTMDIIGSIMFEIGVEDIVVVEKLKGKYV